MARCWYRPTTHRRARAYRQIMEAPRPTRAEASVDFIAKDAYTRNKPRSSRFRDDLRQAFHDNCVQVDDLHEAVDQAADTPDLKKRLGDILVEPQLPPAVTNSLARALKARRRSTTPRQVRSRRESRTSLFTLASRVGLTVAVLPAKLSEAIPAAAAAPAVVSSRSDGPTCQHRPA
jgi:hypothetical protein